MDTKRGKMLLNKADRLRGCGTHGEYVWPDCGHEIPEFKPYRCEVPGCQIPGCGSYVASKQAHKVEEALRKVLPKKKKKWKNNTLKFLTLTTPTGLNAGQKVTFQTCTQNMQMVWKGWNKVCEAFKKKFGQNGYGVYARVEFGEKGMCHLHVVFFGGFIDKNWLTSMWKKETGGKSVKIQKVKGKVRRDGTVLDEISAISKELCKYLTKPASTQADMEIVAACSIAVAGHRTLRARGIFYNVKLDTPIPRHCSTCGCGSYVFYPVKLDDYNGDVLDEDEEKFFNVYENHKKTRLKFPYGGEHCRGDGLFADI